MPATVPGAERTPPRRAPKSNPWQRTVSETDDEINVDGEREQSTATDGDGGSRGTQDVQDTGERARFAERLVELIDRTRHSVGRLEFASDLQLLKRDLSRCHNLSKTSASDVIFQSLVTDVESSLASTGWREITASQLAVIREVIFCAYRLPGLDVAFLREAREKMTKAGIETIPRVDLLSLKIDDDSDDDF
ncbi:MAG: hypothetical protein EXS05_01055 [Planctomycetaceae bacterium]|nr:hypothetical protein [Planctomycetaceae bacterium]